MLSLITQPTSPKLSGEQGLWQFKLSDSQGEAYRSKGSTTKLIASGNITLEVGDSFNLSWMEPNGASAIITFSAVTNPSLETELQGGLNGLTYLAYYQNLASRLNQLPVVGALFQISALQNGANYELIFEAINRDTDFTVDLDISSIQTANFSKSTTVAQADNSPEDYKLSLDVLLENEGKFEKISELSAPVEENGKVELELSSLLSSALLNQLEGEFSTFPSTPIISKRATSYFLRYKEDYAGATTNYVLSSKQTIVLSEVANEEKLGDFLATLNQNSTETILNSYEGVVTLRADQKVFLHWYNWNNQIESPKIRIDAYTDFGASLPTYFYANELSVAPNQIASFPIGLTELGLSSQVKYFKVFINDSADNARFLSANPDFSFKVDRKYYQEAYEFIGLNRFYLAETFVCLGQRSIIENHSRTTAIRFEDFIPTRFQTNYDLEKIYTYRTGYLSAIELNRIVNLLRRNYLWIKEGATYKSFIVNTDSFQTKPINAFTYALSFEGISAKKPK